ncbi:hypothetical protein PanWU01x14_040110 [Parasponia andersonii]|uniref:Uncharacterized protein n=1 Tax=Parasponia andersonii TaxID=3476 RepID=A0A2P5DR43_PARAD|nr:hypothetical protein PanWU01x14_040110 [Parasponia andersonii]
MARSVQETLGLGQWQVREIEDGHIPTRSYKPGGKALISSTKRSWVRATTTVLVRDLWALSNESGSHNPGALATADPRRATPPHLDNAHCLAELTAEALRLPECRVIEGGSEAPPLPSLTVENSGDEKSRDWWHSNPLVVGFLQCERVTYRPELVQEITEKVNKIRERLKVIQSHQKNYASTSRCEVEFDIGDRVFLKVTPMRGVIRFGVKGKLAREPALVGPRRTPPPYPNNAYRPAELTAEDPRPPECRVAEGESEALPLPSLTVENSGDEKSRDWWHSNPLEIGKEVCLSIQSSIEKLIFHKGAIESLELVPDTSSDRSTAP